MSTPPFRVPARPHRVEETIKRSRFITTAAHAPDVEAARDFIDSVRQEFPDATHHCWAFVTGPPGDSAHIGMSDDGEPHGTAGRPMLNTLLHGDVGEIVCVCTRFYGGTKLGTGGLSRAYSGGVALMLESLPTRRKVERTAVSLTADYAQADAIRRILEDTDALVDEEIFDAEVHWKLRVAKSGLEQLRQRVADASRGEATFRLDGGEDNATSDPGGDNGREAGGTGA